MKVRILNWEKINEKRKDVKHPTWFRMDNDLPQSQSLFGLSAVERYVFVCLLCLASKQQAAEIEFEIDWFCYYGGNVFETKDVLSALERMNGKCLEVTSGDVPGTCRGRDVHETRPLRGRDGDVTLQTDITDLTDITDKTDVSRDAIAGRDGSGSLVWNAYADAYEDRYQVKPPRNAKANALCKQLVKRLGAEEAVEVARFYLSHNLPWYVQKGHALDALIADCEKLRTEWKTGNVIRGPTRAEQNSDNNRALFQQVQRGEL